MRSAAPPKNESQGSPGPCGSPSMPHRKMLPADQRPPSEGTKKAAPIDSTQIAPRRRSFGAGGEAQGEMDAGDSVERRERQTANATPKRRQGTTVTTYTGCANGRRSHAKPASRMKSHEDVPNALLNPLSNEATSSLSGWAPASVEHQDQRQAA